MNLWNSKSLQIPPINTYKAENANIDIKHLARVFKDGHKYFNKEHYMKAEYKVMSIIIYRTKQKFRTSKDFKALEKIYKALGNYFGVNISRDLKSFIKLIPTKYTSETYLPNKSVLDYILVRLQGMVKLLERIVDMCKVTADLFDARLRTGHFWKLGFIVFSLVSRIYVLAKHGAKFVCDFYNKIVPFSHQLRNNGRNWLPNNYILPPDLQKWLNVDWLDVDDEIQIIESPAVTNIIQFFDLVDDDDDVQFCDEYIMIGDDETELTKEFNKLDDVKTSIQKMRGFDVDEDVGEIMEDNDDSFLCAEKTPLPKSPQVEVEESNEPDFGEAIEIDDSFQENSQQTRSSNDTNEVIVINNSLSTLNESIVELDDSVQIVDENSFSNIGEINCLGSSTPLTKAFNTENKTSAEKSTAMQNGLSDGDVTVINLTRKKKKKRPKKKKNNSIGTNNEDINIINDNVKIKCSDNNNGIKTEILQNKNNKLTNNDFKNKKDIDTTKRQLPVVIDLCDTPKKGKERDIRNNGGTENTENTKNASSSKKRKLQDVESFCKKFKNSLTEVPLDINRKKPELIEKPNKRNFEQTPNKVTNTLAIANTNNKKKGEIGSKTCAEKSTATQSSFISLSDGDATIINLTGMKKKKCSKKKTNSITTNKDINKEKPSHTLPKSGLSSSNENKMIKRKLQRVGKQNKTNFKQPKKLKQIKKKNNRYFSKYVV